MEKVNYKAEIKRKIVHYCTLIFPVAYFFSPEDSKLFILILTGFGILIIGIFEFLRLRNEKLNQKLLELFKGTYRDEEAHKISALVFTFSGIFLTVLLFPKNLAILTLLFFIFGDGSAALIGKGFGRIKIFDKTLEGGIANFITCIIVGILYTKFLDVEISKFAIISGALVCSLAEIIPMPLNDNLRVPILTGLVIFLLK